MDPREFQLLLYCARSRFDAGAIRDLVDEGINWQTLLAFAQQHGIRPLLLRSLKAVCWDAVPEPTQLELERFNRANLRKNLCLANELFRLLEVFQQNGIPIATFKGPVLAESVYGDLSLREFSDLDVLIHEQDLDKAEALLTVCGYQAQFPDGDYRSTFVSYQGQYSFHHGDTGIMVDLHWRLSGKGTSFPLNSAEVWPRLRQLIITGHSIPTLAQDDLALFLAGHGTKEGWRSLNWVCDFAELVRKCPDIHWAEVLDRAQRSGASRALLLAVLLSATLLGPPVPVELLNKARNGSAIRVLAERAQLRMIHAEPKGELWELFNSLKTHDRLRQRIWPLVTVLTTRTVGDHKGAPLPKPLWGIYYLMRPFRLAGKVAKRMIGQRGTSKNCP